MVNRRQFVRDGVTLSAVTASTLGTGVSISTAFSTAQAATPSLERFIFDPRFSESYDIGSQMAESGIAATAVADDLMSLWYDELDLAWRDQPMYIGGATLPEVLFILETFAADRGMRVVYRGEHSTVIDGRIRHELKGPQSLIDAFTPAPSDSLWIPTLAAAMQLRPQAQVNNSETSFDTRVDALSLRDMPLVTWIIAPRQSAREQ